MVVPSDSFESLHGLFVAFTVSNDYTTSAHPSCRCGPKFRNHRACRALACVAAQRGWERSACNKDPHFWIFAAKFCLANPNINIHKCRTSKWFFFVVFFFVVGVTLSRLRSTALIRHSFVQAKWPTLARFVCVNKRHQTFICAPFFC